MAVERQQIKIFSADVPVNLQLNDTFNRDWDGRSFFDSRRRHGKCKDTRLIRAKRGIRSLTL